MSVANSPILITDGSNSDKRTDDDGVISLSMLVKITDIVTVKERICMQLTVTNAYEVLGFFKEFNIRSKKIGLGGESHIQHKIVFLE